MIKPNYEGEFDFNTRNIMEDGDHMTIQEFVDACKVNAFVDDDGQGYYASDVCMYLGNLATPSVVSNGTIDDRFSHVVWINK